MAARVNTGLDVLEWAKRMEASGAGELLLTSMDRDGTGKGFDLHAAQGRLRCRPPAGRGLRRRGHACSISSRAPQAGATGLLAASVFHFGQFSIAQVKQALLEASLPVRPPAPTNWRPKMNHG